ncbi:MAG: DMT family transporter [Alphaproteobacteria bacterium]|nr:DMT family transporter [Alphaproteobacteria bacterium]
MKSASTMGRQLWLTACLLYIGIAWGLVPSLARLATSEGADALNATFLQSLVGGVVLLALTLVRGKRFHLSWRHLWVYTGCGFAGTTIPTAIVFAAAPEVGAGMIAIIIALAPILTYFGALVLGLEPHGFWRLAGIGLGFAAVLLIVLPDLEIEVGSLTAWLLITLFIPICYAIESLIIALRRPPEGDAMMLVAGMLLSSALVLLPVVLLGGAANDILPGWDTASIAVGSIAAINVTAYVIFLYLISAAGPVFATFAGYLNMVAGVIWGIVLWQESHSSWVWGAVVLLAVAMYLVKERRPQGT